MQFRPYLIVLAASLVVAFNSCSGNKLVVKIVANALSTGAGSSFTGDDDPELVGQALPFALKLYETLLAQTPDNVSLCLATGSGFIMYANAYIQGPADILPDAEFNRKKDMTARAKRLYLRGRDYVFQGLAVDKPGFSAAADQAELDRLLALAKKSDVPYLYWAAAGWMAAYAADPFDIEMGAAMPRALSLMNRALAIDEGFDHGAIHEFFISYYGSLPASMGGSEEKARKHFTRAVELSGGRKAGPYVALAASVSVKTQNLDEFTALLGKALAVDTKTKNEHRLVNVIAQDKARWLLDHRGDRFLIDSKEGE